MARFKTTMKFDQHEVGYAVDRNKKLSKLAACKHILHHMVPNLYRDWLETHKPGSQHINIHHNSMIENPRPQSPSLDNMMSIEDGPLPIDSQNEELQSQFNALSLDQLIAITQETKTQEELALEYTEHQIELFREKKDAPIGDKRILDCNEYVHLTKKHKPMALMNTLKQKETGTYNFEENSVQRQDPVFGVGAQGSLWYTEILINKSPVGKGISQVKKMSAHYAALDMFANIFPRGTTWLQVTEFIATQKKPLQELQRMKDAVQI